MEGEADDTLRALVPGYDLMLTYGGGERVVQRYEALGARRCVPIYNALDPLTHHPVPAATTLRAPISRARQPAARPRGAGGGVLLPAVAALPRAELPARRRGLG